MTSRYPSGQNNSFSQFEEMFLQLAENIDDVFWIRTEEGALYVNEAFEAIFGIPRTRFYQDPGCFTSMIPSEDAQKLSKFLDVAAFHKPEILKFDYRIIRPDGTTRWLHTKSVPVSNQRDEVEKRIAITRDMTDERLKDLKIRESEQRYRKMFEHMPSGVAIYRPIDGGTDFEITDFNKTAFKNTNLPADKAIGSSLLTEFPFMVNTPFYKALQETMKDHKAREIEPFYYKDDQRAGWRKNTIYWLSTGEAVAIFNDITKQMEDEQSLKEQNIELQKANKRVMESDRLKSLFLQNMSHEIRTPLNAIAGFSMLINDPSLTLDEMNSYAQIIQNSSDQLIGVVTDIMTMSSIQSNQERVSVTEIEINILMENLYCIFNRHAERQKLKLSVNVSFTTPPLILYSDKDKLTKIFSNLLSNAIKFTHQGTVEMGYRIDENQITFSVKDTGIGIHPDVQQHIFTNFAQAEKSTSRIYGGTGLGLSISQGYAELLKGNIWLKSEPNQGSEFFFSIPLLTDMESAHRFYAEMKS